MQLIEVDLEADGPCLDDRRWLQVVIGGVFVVVFVFVFVFVFGVHPKVDLGGPCLDDRRWLHDSEVRIITQSRGADHADAGLPLLNIDSKRGEADIFTELFSQTYLSLPLNRGTVMEMIVFICLA